MGGTRRPTALSSTSAEFEYGATQRQLEGKWTSWHPKDQTKTEDGWVRKKPVTEGGDISGGGQSVQGVAKASARTRYVYGFKGLSSYSDPQGCAARSVQS